MSHPISDVTRRVVYSGSAGVGPYSFSFEILAETDIAVYLNTTLLTLTTNYTVSIGGAGTGSVTLVTPATGADTVTLVGDRAIERTTDFVTGGDLFANTLNDELDSLTIFAQQINERVSRSLRAPITDPVNVNVELPLKADRASKYLAFDANGDPIALNGTTSVPGTLGNQDANDVAITGGTINGVVITEQVYALSGTTPAISPTNGSIQTWTLSGASTPTAGTWAAGQSITLMIDDGTAYTVTWSSMAIEWKTGGGNAPTLNTTGYTAIVLWKVGSTIYGARVGNA